MIRAYGAGARNVLREAPRETMISNSAFRVYVASSSIGTVYDSVSKVGGGTSDEEYDTNGNLTVTISCATSLLEELRGRLIDSTRGTAIFPDDS